MNKETPKDLENLVGSTPNAVHSAYLMDFHSSIDKYRDLLYYPVSLDKLENIDDSEDKLSEIREDTNNAYTQLINNGLYWEFCSFKVYKETYNSRKEDFLKTFYDADEYDFLLEEQKQFNRLLDETMSYLDETGYPKDTGTTLISEILNTVNYKNIEFSYSKKHLFISDKISKIKQPKFEPTSINLEWNGDKSNLIEVIEALIVNENIKGTKKDIYKTFGLFFNEDLSNNAITVSKFNIRNGGNETKFLDELKKSLLDEINAKLEKKR